MPTNKKRSTSTRETLKSENTTFFAKRTAKGRFNEMDEKARSLAADRRKTGQGDRERRAVHPRTSKALTVRPEVHQRFVAVLERAAKRAAEEDAARRAELHADKARNEAGG